MGKVFDRNPYFYLIVICLVSYGFSLFHLPVTDRDEGRFVQATKQMVETGDYLTIKFQEEFRNKKPAGIYWLQAAAVHLCNQPLNLVWPYRIPSLLCSLFAVLLTYFLSSRLFDASIARTAALLLASSTVVIVEATTAKTDAALLLTTLLAVGLLALGYRDQTKRLTRSLVLGCSLAAGAMIKGPLVIFFFVMTLLGLLFLDKNGSWLKAFHWPLILAIPIFVVIPWFILIQQATGGQFAQDSLGQDFSQKILSAQEGHGAPPGFFTLSLFIGLWSCALWLPLAFKEGWKKRTPSLTFCFAAVIPAFCVLELIPTKLIHYPLPLYPWLAMITAWGLNEISPFLRSGFNRWTQYVWLLMTFIMASTFVVISIYLDVDATTKIITLSLGVLLLTLGLISYKTQRPYSILAALVIFPCALSLWLPRLTPLWVTEKIYDELSPHNLSRPILLMGYGEPSAAFRLGTHVLMTKKTDTLTKFIQNSDGHLFIESKLIKADVEKILDNTPGLYLKGEISGINYNKMKPIRLKHYILEKQIDLNSKD